MPQINVQIRFTNRKGTVLCFKHAAQAAVNQNEDIACAVDDFDSEYFLGSTLCSVCSPEDTED